MIIRPPSRNTGFQMLLSVTFVLCVNAAAIAQEYGYDVWTTANGLPQNTVTGLTQTPDGYLWLSTFDGLARFDGVRFTIFDRGNTKGILNNRFAGILADKEGAVWAITENGVVTVYRNGEFSSYQVPETGPTMITSDRDGNATIETNERFYSLSGGAFLPGKETKEKGIRKHYGRLGAVWTFDENKTSREKDGEVTSYPLVLPIDYLTSGFALRCFEDHQEALWISFDKKLYRMADGAIAAFTVNDVPALEAAFPNVMLSDADGSTWFIFEAENETLKKDSQLVRFKDNKFTSYNLGKWAGATLGTTDREGNFWIATVSGLRRLRRQLITSLSTKEGLNHNEVYPLLETSGGDILIGSVRGVNRYKDGTLTDLGLKYSDGSAFYMRGLWEDSGGRVWLGFQGEGGFGRIEGASGFKRYIGKADLPTGATDFASDNEGNVWVASEEGLLKYKNDEEIAHYTAKDGLASGRVITVHPDRNGDLWLGTFDGVSRLTDGTFTNFADVENSPKGFVRVIYEDAGGVLWFGTYSDGLVRYKDGKFFNYRVENGLYNNGVFTILEDRGNLWMSSNRGIHRVSKQELNDLADGKIPKLNSISYDESDGMLNAECNGGRIPAGIRTRDGKLWFATMGGIAIVDPAAEGIDPAPPPAVIENIAIDRKPVGIRGAKAGVELQPGQSNIAIEYTGMSLVRSDQIKFRYKLEGLEENWIEAGTKRAVDYSYLPAGNYTFRVIAASANGVWNNEGAAIRIIVNPYFYQTSWFRLLASLAVALIIGWIYHNRISQLRKIAEAKTLFSRQLIEAQEAESKRIASELHDGLGQSLVVIKNRAMLGLKKSDDKGRVEKELESISESATHALDEVREITNNMRPQLLDRLGLTKALISMCKKVAGVVEVECDAADIDGVFSEIEEISLYRIVQESLNNIIKHSNASDARVLVKRDTRSVIVEIEDNGSGFDPESVKGGLGLVGLKERAQLLNGELVIDSKAGEGTKVRLRIDK